MLTHPAVPRGSLARAQSMNKLGAVVLAVPDIDIDVFKSQIVAFQANHESLSS